MEHGAREKQFKDFDLAAVCAQLLDFYEPLAESKGVTMIADAATPVRFAATRTSCAKRSRT